MKLTYTKKEEAAEPEKLANGAQVKQFIATDIMVDTDERTVTATITTSAVDRFGEVVVSGGANLDNFTKNPVVLWVHNSHELPIGRALWLRKTKNKIVAKIQFAAKEVNEFAEQVFQMYKAGFLKAFSIGFRPDFDEMRAPKPEDIKKNPEWAAASRIFFKWELLEFSAVPVPANPEALATAVKAHDIAASPELLKQLGYEIEDDGSDEIDIEEIHLASDGATGAIKIPMTTGTMTLPDKVAKEILAQFDDVSADAEPILVKSFIEAEPVIEAERAFNVKPFKTINVDDTLTDRIKRHKGKVFD